MDGTVFLAWELLGETKNFSGNVMKPPSIREAGINYGPVFLTGTRWLGNSKEQPKPNSSFNFVKYRSRD
jgi:hypothetical protein